MAKGASKKLKVFQTRIGFHDVVIATASKAAALRAFGVRQDLFAQGLASIATEPGIVDAALAHPDTLLRRPVGSDQPFGTDPGRPKVADMPREAERRDEEKKRPDQPQKATPPPDRTRLSAAEAELTALDRRHDEEEAALRRELEAVAAEENELRARKRALEVNLDEGKQMWQQRRSRAEKAVERERQSYRRAGGDA